MIGWIILGILALVLAVVALTPVHVRVTCDADGLTAGVRYGPLRLRLYPRPAGEKEKKAAKPEKKKKEKPEKKKKPTAKINREQIFYSLEKLPPVLGRALKRVGRRIVITPLQVYLLIAGTDPADTAQLYGRLTSALAGGLPGVQGPCQVVFGLSEAGVSAACGKRRVRGREREGDNSRLKGAAIERSIWSWRRKIKSAR